MNTEGKYRILILTDHKAHHPKESLYPLLREMRKHPSCGSIEVASKGAEVNRDFFKGRGKGMIYSTLPGPHFRYQSSGKQFERRLRAVHPSEFDVVLLRQGRPKPKFLHFLTQHADAARIINRPEGILEAGSKQFLLTFPELCPPMRICRSIEEVESLKNTFPIVLKPFFGSGGKGILRISEEEVWDGLRRESWQNYLPRLEKKLKKGLLAMKYLPNVEQGDKRIIVVNGQITGSALRLPAKGSWLCNVSQGGSETASPPDENERRIAEIVTPEMQRRGVVIFGFDTLVDDNGQRVLSEINAANPGGMLPAQLSSGEPVVRRSARELWKYIQLHIGALR
ncbi:MAG: hypothetical protein EAZ89_17725 [Bacteroidetes bacterium]|nr:MAG: hypothetical protein EAZ89_17725 [Bacteroidota bacterium]